MTDTAQWVTFFTVVVGFLYQAYRENRQRRWDKEDRAELAAKVVNEARRVADRVTGESNKLGEAIEANTEISTRAFREANSVNQKIESLGIENNALQQRAEDREIAK